MNKPLTLTDRILQYEARYPGSTMQPVNNAGSYSKIFIAVLCAGVMTMTRSSVLADEYHITGGLFSSIAHVLSLSVREAPASVQDAFPLVFEDEDTIPIGADPGENDGLPGAPEPDGKKGVATTLKAVKSDITDFRVAIQQMATTDVEQHESLNMGVGQSIASVARSAVTTSVDAEAVSAVELDTSNGASLPTDTSADSDPGPAAAADTSGSSSANGTPSTPQANNPVTPNTPAESTPNNSNQDPQPTIVNNRSYYPTFTRLYRVTEAPAIDVSSLAQSIVNAVQNIAATNITNIEISIDENSNPIITIDTSAVAGGDQDTDSNADTNTDVSQDNSSGVDGDGDDDGDGDGDGDYETTPGEDGDGDTSTNDSDSDQDPSDDSPPSDPEPTPEPPTPATPPTPPTPPAPSTPPVVGTPTK
ncbi:MAG: hypothetical protein ABIA92_04760 [Patescibacteria group bacterium]